MTLKWIDGFEGYGTTLNAAPEPLWILGNKYEEYREGSSSSYTQVKSGREIGRSLYLSNDYLRKTVDITDDTTVLGVGVYFENVESNYFVSMYSSQDLSAGIAIIQVGDELRIDRGPTELGTTVDLNLAQDTWYYLELKVVVGITGSFELRIDGTTVLSDSGVDTRPTASVTYLNSFRLGNTVSPEVRYDDLYFCDGIGSVNNDFLGKSKVVAVFPDGDGNYSQFTPLSGDNYTNIGEEEVDNDTTYIESSTVGHKDSYTYEDINDPAIMDVYGIQVNTTCRKTGASDLDIKTLIRTNSTDYTDSSQPIVSSGYQFADSSSVFELNPDTSAFWLPSEIDDSEFGMEVA